MVRHLTLFFSLAFSLAVSAEEFRDKSSADKLLLSADKNDETTRTLFQITKNIHQFLILKLSKIPGKAPNVLLKIEGTPPSTDTFRVIYFKRKDLQTMNSMEIVDKIMNALICRTLVSLGADSKITSPEWMTAGLVYQFMIGETMSSEEKYPLTRLTVINQKYPDLDQLLSGKAPSPGNFWLYTIFAERSAVFHRGISSLKSGKNKLLNYLIDRKNANVIDSFSEHYDEFKSSRTRKKWFKSSCFKVCFDVINPYPPEEIRQKVSNLLSVTVARPGNNSFGTMRIPLEELTSENTKFIDTSYITFLERDLIELTLTSSETIRPSLQALTLSLELFKKGEIDDFKESIKVSKQKFQKAIERQVELNRFLDELEAKYNTSQTDYRKVIQAEELSAAKEKKLFPDFNAYLDEIEKKLADTVIE